MTDTNYISIAKQILQRAKSEGWFIHDSVNAKNRQWKTQLVKDCVTLQSKEMPSSSIPIYKVVGEYQKKYPETLIKEIWEVSSLADAQKNDPKVTSWRLLDHGIYSDADNDQHYSWRVIEQTNSMIWPIWPRHTVFAQVRIDDRDSDPQTTYLISYSIDHPNAQTLPDHVINNVHYSVYEYISTPEKVRVSRVTHIDPCGNIPTSLIKLYSNKLVDLFLSWKSE